jgi:hypothetical protein
MYLLVSIDIPFYQYSLSGTSAGASAFEPPTTKMKEGFEADIGSLGDPYLR